MTATRAKWLTLGVCLGAMLAIFNLALPHVFVDRMSENWYLGVAYSHVKNGDFWITYGDPFVENSPFHMYVMAYLAHATHSLYWLRYYQFVFSLLIFALLFVFFFHQHSSRSFSPGEIGLVGLIMLTVWLLIPMAMIYPVQANGMAPAIASFIIGLLLIDEHPNWAVFAFGTAYSFKGQFLATLPGILAYTLFIDTRHEKWTRQVMDAAICFVIFFIPTTVVITFMGWVFHMFRNSEDLWHYSFNGQHILANEYRHFVRHFIDHLPPDVDSASTRRIEYRGFGLITWSLIGTSILSCLFYAARSALQRYGDYFGGRTRINKPLTLLGLAGSCYWFNYLFFWDFPFYYNTLAILFFNLFICAACVEWIRGYMASRFGSKGEKIFLSWVALMTMLVFLNRLAVSPGFFRAHPAQGDSLTPYDWMK